MRLFCARNKSRTYPHTFCIYAEKKRVGCGVRSVVRVKICVCGVFLFPRLFPFRLGFHTFVFKIRVWKLGII